MLPLCCQIDLSVDLQECRILPRAPFERALHEGAPARTRDQDGGKFAERGVEVASTESKVVQGQGNKGLSNSCLDGANRVSILLELFVLNFLDGFIGAFRC